MEANQQKGSGGKKSFTDTCFCMSQSRHCLTGQKPCDGGERDARRGQGLSEPPFHSFAKFPHFPCITRG